MSLNLRLPAKKTYLSSVSLLIDNLRAQEPQDNPDVQEIISLCETLFDKLYAYTGKSKPKSEYHCV